LDTFKSDRSFDCVVGESAAGLGNLDVVRGHLKG
jgi:hypothetical protein